jgi:hypothetical protein
MACELITTGGGVFALWGKPEIADIDRVTVGVEAAAASCGHPVVYVTRVPVRAPAPAQRLAGLRNLDVITWCDEDGGGS